MNVMEKFHAAQVLVTVLEEGNSELKKARADGHVTLAECVEIFARVTKAAVEAANLGELVVFSTTRRGPRKNSHD